MRVIQPLVADALVHIQVERLFGRLEFAVGINAGWRVDRFGFLRGN
jgi:hypothetical protein